MIFRVYSEDFEGFENKEEFNDEQKAIEAAKNNSKTGNYKKVIAVKENSDDPRFPEEEVIWSSDNIGEAVEDDFEVEEKENIDKPYNDGLNVGDHVVIKGLAEDSPWEGLEGEVIWIDEEDFGDDFQTITVRVNFPTEKGVKEINQNFDRRNVIKSEAPVEAEEPVEEPEPEPEPRPAEEPDLYDSANEGLDEKIASRKFKKQWIEDKDGNIVEVRYNGKSIHLGDKVGEDDFVTGFDPETNTVFLDEDPNTEGGRDYSVEDVFGESLEEKYDNGFFILKKKDTGEFLCWGSRGNSWGTPYYYLDKKDDAAKIFHDDRDVENAFTPRKWFSSVNDNVFREEDKLKPEDFERIYYSVTNSSANESLKNGRIESREDAIIDKLIARLRNDYGLEGRYLYDACLDAGMTEEEVKAFVISPEEFGENLNENEDKDMEEKEKVKTEEPVETPVEEPEAEVETEVEVEPEEPIEEPEIEEPIEEPVEEPAPEEETAEEEPVEEPTEEEPEEKPVQTIELPHEEYTEPEDIKRINDELGIKAQEGKVLGIRKEDNMLLLAEPEINGIWAIYLNEEGYIKKIVLF